MKTNTKHRTLKILKTIKLWILMFLFSGCIVIGPVGKTYTYTSDIYATVVDGKIDRMSIPESNTNEMNVIIGKKYGFSFVQKYNFIEAPRLYNKGYVENEDYNKNHYIKFYNDIKIVIGDKTFVIPKEKIKLEDDVTVKPYYTYDAPIDVGKSNYNNIIVDLGVIEILNKAGEILRPKTKVPKLLIKKVYYKVQYRENYRSVPTPAFYNGWAEIYPKKDEDLNFIPIKPGIINIGSTDK